MNKTLARTVRDMFARVREAIETLEHGLMNRRLQRVPVRARRITKRRG